MLFRSAAESVSAAPALTDGEICEVLVKKVRPVLSKGWHVNGKALSAWCVLCHELVLEKEVISVLEDKGCIKAFGLDEGAVYAADTKKIQEMLDTNRAAENPAPTSAPAVKVSAADKALYEVVKTVYPLTVKSYYVLANGSKFNGRMADADAVEMAIRVEDIGNLERTGILSKWMMDDFSFKYLFDSREANKLYQAVNPSSASVQASNVPVNNNSQGAQTSMLSNADIKEFYTFLRNRRNTYVPTRLHGDLARYNGKLLTMKLNNAVSAMAAVISRKENIKMSDVGTEKIQAALDELVARKFLKEVRVTDCNKYKSVPQYFITGTANWFMEQMGSGKDFFVIPKKNN